MEETAVLCIWKEELKLSFSALSNRESSLSKFLWILCTHYNSSVHMTQWFVIQGLSTLKYVYNIYIYMYTRTSSPQHTHTNSYCTDLWKSDDLQWLHKNNWMCVVCWSSMFSCISIYLHCLYTHFVSSYELLLAISCYSGNGNNISIWLVIQITLC